VSSYATSSPVTDTSETVALAGLSAPNDARTTDGTGAPSVTCIADATPIAAPPTGAETSAGHTRIELDAMVTAIRRRVGATTNTRPMLALPAAVTLILPALTLVESELGSPLDELTSADGGTTVSPSASANVTATEVCVPATSVTVPATAPSVAEAASAATVIAADASASVYPSGAVTTTTNLTVEGGAALKLAVVVYCPIAAAPLDATYA
jgi:hypothetical protein